MGAAVAQPWPALATSWKALVTKNNLWSIIWKKMFLMTIVIRVHGPVAASLLITQLRVPVLLSTQQRRQCSQLASIAGGDQGPPSI